MTRIIQQILFVAVVAGAIIAYFALRPLPIDQAIDQSVMFAKEYGACPFPGEKISLSEEEWKKRLTPEQFAILREGGTETAYTGSLYDNKEEGTYLCAACSLPLFSSKEKYDSKTGWPSFWAPIDPCNIGYEVDTLLFVARVEVLCNRCGSHLGHVFDDGPAPTFHRYCLNSIALKFEKKE